MIIDTTVLPLIQQVIAVTLFGEQALTPRAHHTDPVLIDEVLERLLHDSGRDWGHDLRNSFQVIVGVVDILKMLLSKKPLIRATDEEEIRERVEKIAELGCM